MPIAWAGRARCKAICSKSSRPCITDARACDASGKGLSYGDFSNVKILNAPNALNTLNFVSLLLAGVIN